jgi:hypothetical protein
MRLNQMIGDVLLAIVPSLDETLGGGPHELKLISVDIGGIWVEC